MGNLKPEIVKTKKLKVDIQKAESGEGLIPAGEVYLTKEAVAKRLGLKPKTVSDWANAGKLPAYHLGRYLRFKWVEIDQHLAATSRVGGQKTEAGSQESELNRQGVKDTKYELQK